MKTSFDWVRRHAFRALDAERAAPGVDEDSAYAVAWLEACGYPGLQWLADALDTTEPGARAAGLDAPQDGAIEAHGRSCLFFAPTLIDYLVALGEEGPVAHHEGLAVENARHPMALVACAARYCPAGCAIGLTWRSGDGDAISAHVSGTGAHIEGGAGDDTGAPVERIALSFDARFGESAGTKESSELDRRLAQSLSGGVEVDDAAFARVADYAAGILVPESEESRARGAGAGLTDND